MMTVRRISAGIFLSSLASLGEPEAAEAPFIAGGERPVPGRCAAGGHVEISGPKCAPVFIGDAAFGPSFLDAEQTGKATGKCSQQA